MFSPVPSIALGFDVETHDWEKSDKKKGSFGQHGFYTLTRPPDLEARIVQLGWAVWTESEGVHVVQKTIRPDGWIVSEKAVQCHGITQDEALKSGVPIKDALAEFLRDVRHVCGQGGKLVSHHIEFDAGIIAREIQRAGDDPAAWSQLVRRHGLCTMSPVVGRYLCDCVGRDPGPETAMPTLKLEDVVSWLAPEDHRLAKYHAAGWDARLHVRVYIELARLCKELV
jgi:DNA polymerase III epsilon subunit-like protein